MSLDTYDDCYSSINLFYYYLKVLQMKKSKILLNNCIIIK